MDRWVGGRVDRPDRGTDRPCSGRTDRRTEDALPQRSQGSAPPPPTPQRCGWEPLRPAPPAIGRPPFPRRFMNERQMEGGGGGAI